MKLFIGSLPYEMSEEELRELFEAHGEVLSVKIIIDRDTGRSKGFGFVEYSSEDDARDAINKLNNSSVKGRNIVVNEAREKSASPRRF